MEDTFDKVIFEQASPSVCEILLNNNAKLNALTPDMVNSIGNKLKEWKSASAEEVPRVVIMSGTGGKSFCAGGDVVCLYNAHVGKEGFDASLKTSYLANEYTVDYNL